MTRSFFAFVLALSTCGTAVAESAVVHQVIDGDTIYACGSGCYTVRIANIDAPEMPPKAKCEREAETAPTARITLALAIEGRTVELVPEPARATVMAGCFFRREGHGRGADCGRLGAAMDGTAGAVVLT